MTAYCFLLFYVLLKSRLWISYPYIIEKAIINGLVSSKASFNVFTIVHLSIWLWPTTISLWSL